MSKHPLPGFVSSSKALLKEEKDFPYTQTKEGFDPNAYKLVEGVNYDFQNPTTLGKVIKAMPRALNETQQTIQGQGGSEGGSKVELGYTSVQPISTFKRTHNSSKILSRRRQHMCRLLSEVTFFSR